MKKYLPIIMEPVSQFDVEVNDSGAGGIETGTLWTTLKSPETQADKKDVSYMFEHKPDGNLSAEEKKVTEPYGIYPAFALDLSQVEFGSVVDRVTGATAADTVGRIDTSQEHAMLLRLDGDLKNSGGRAVDVAYNNSQISYKNAPSGSRIIVQGKGLQDTSALDGVEWYWVSGALDSKGTFSSASVAGIVAGKLGVADYKGDLALSNCKIWLEDTSSSLGGMPYAYEAHAGVVDQIILAGVDEPAGDERLSLTASVADGVGETKGIRETQVTITWICLAV